MRGDSQGRGAEDGKNAVSARGLDVFALRDFVVGEYRKFATSFTTGTGSGKSLCFFIPIVDAVLRQKQRGAAPGTRAIVVYPMNALANSQLEELDKFLGNLPGEKPVTYGRYTGQEDSKERQRIADNPPDILLTNFMMLELLMTRQEERDRRVLGHCSGLRFLVLDELHTYRGRQGADVALLVRRVRERLSRTDLQCIGTSATMASEGSLQDKNADETEDGEPADPTAAPRQWIVPMVQDRKNALLVQLAESARGPVRPVMEGDRPGDRMTGASPSVRPTTTGSFPSAHPSTSPGRTEREDVR